MLYKFSILLSLFFLFSCKMKSSVPAIPNLKLEVWEEIEGYTPEGMESFMENKPSMTKIIHSLDIDGIDKDYYVARVKAYLVPKKSGTYEFRFSSTDDGGSLFLSMDSNPENKKNILFLETWSNGEPVGPSSEFKLEAGKKYYVELILKENLGEDYVYVEWKEKDDLGYSQITELQPYK